MSLEISPHLVATRDLLAGSLRIRRDECAPSLPHDLAVDLCSPGGGAMPTPQPFGSIADRILRFCARPGFGLAAAAALVAIVVGPSILDSRKGGESFRGTPGISNSLRVHIVLLGGPDDIRSTIQSAPDFEGLLVSSVTHHRDAEEVAGPKVVVDFEKSILVSIDAAGNEHYREHLPSDTGELELAIAKAITRLD